MYWEYKINQHLRESYKMIVRSESLPPGFNFGDEIVDLEELPIEGKDIHENKEIDPTAEPLPVRHKGSEINLDDIVKSKFKDYENGDQIIDIARGIYQTRIAKPMSKKEKQKHVDNLLRLGLSKEEAIETLRRQIKLAKKDLGREIKSDDVASADRLQRLIHNSEVLKILTDDGSSVDGEKFKNLINVVPDNIISRNEKIKKSGKKGEHFYEITLPAYQGLWYDNKDQKFRLLRTCPSAGECKMYCYATKGGYVQYKETNLKQIRILNFLMNDWKGFKKKILDEIKEAKRLAEKVVIRWHDSGDFFVDSYVQIAFDVARETPDVTHYAYTKSVGLVRKLESSKPDNFVFNFSEGGLQDKKLSFNDKNSKVIPKVLWKDIFGADKNFKNEDKLNQLKSILAKVYGSKGLEQENILTYDEMMEMPEGDIPRWHVIVTPKDGDDSARRKDVISTLLLIH